MNYQTDIDFALRVLQDAEDNSFNKAKMQEMMQHDVDYMRVFLPDTQAFYHIIMLANLMKHIMKEEQAMTVKVGALYRKQETLEVLLEKAAGISTLEARIRQELEQINIELKPFRERLRSAEAPPIQTTMDEMVCWFRNLLQPSTTSKAFEDELQKAIRQFYKNKRA